MKYGICADATHIELAARQGYDYIELPIRYYADNTDSQIREIRKRAEDAGIAIEACNSVFPGDVRLVEEGYSEERLKEYTKRIMEIAEMLGIQMLVVGSGPARMLTGDTGEKEGLARLSESFEMIGDIAFPHQITVTIEPLCHLETNLVNKVSEGAVFVRRLNHPSVKLMADLYHVYTEQEKMDVIRVNKDILKHIHFCNPVGRKMPNIHDSYDYSEFAQALKDIGFDSRFSVEIATPKQDMNLAEYGVPALEVSRKIFEEKKGDRK